MKIVGQYLRRSIQKLFVGTTDQSIRRVAIFFGALSFLTIAFASSYLSSPTKAPDVKVPSISDIFQERRERKRSENLELQRNISQMRQIFKSNEKTDI